MQSIKLRFWCDEHKYVEFGFNGPITTLAFNQRDEVGVACPLCFKHRPMKIEQFTGAIAAEGVEVYGGDIVTCGGGYDTDECEDPARVYFEDGQWWTTCVYECTSTPLFEFDLSHVIGNVNEDPGLLSDSRPDNQP